MHAQSSPSYPCSHLAALVSVILTGVYRYRVMGFVGISLTPNDIEHNLMDYLHPYIFFGEMSVQLFCLFSK